MRISDWSSDVCSSNLKTIDLVLDVGGLGIDRGAEAIFLRLPDHALHLATEADEIFLLVLGDLIAPIALARFPDMARHREADAAIFAEHDRAVRLERRRPRHILIGVDVEHLRHAGRAVDIGRASWRKR